MKKILTTIFIISAFCVNTVFAEELTPVEEQPTKMEQFAQTTEVNAKKAGNVIKEKSVKAAKSTAKHTKSGAKKLGAATARQANRATRATAKGVKKMGEKMQSGAEKTIESTTKKLEATEPKKKCNCGENCNCPEEKCKECEVK